MVIRGMSSSATKRDRWISRANDCNRTHCCRSPNYCRAACPDSKRTVAALVERRAMLQSRAVRRLCSRRRRAIEFGPRQRRIAKMVTVLVEGRGFRVVWLLEEMRLAYRLRPVDLLAGVENDTEYLAHQPRGVHSRHPGWRRYDGRVDCDYGVPDGPLLPTPLAPEPHDPAFPAYPPLSSSTRHRRSGAPKCGSGRRSLRY